MKSNGFQIKEYFENIEKLTGKQNSNPLEFDVINCGEIIRGIVQKLELYSDTLSVLDFMEVTGMGETKIWRLIRTNKLKTINVHGQYRIIPRIWVLEYICCDDFLTYIKNYR